MYKSPTHTPKAKGIYCGFSVESNALSPSFCGINRQSARAAVNGRLSTALNKMWILDSAHKVETREKKRVFNIALSLQPCKKRLRNALSSALFFKNTRKRRYNRKIRLSLTNLNFIYLHYPQPKHGIADNDFI